MVTLESVILELKLRKVGNSVGVILPKEALAHLKVAEGDSVSVTEGPDGSLRLSPSKAEITRQIVFRPDPVDTRPCKT